jgi:universal stress protein E
MNEFKRILVIIDPTSKEQHALKRAVWLARKMNASLELFICDYDQYLAGERFFEAKALAKARASLLAGHIQRLKKLASEAVPTGVPVAVDAVWDKPLHEGIVRKALHSKADLVVKDTHYHAAIRRALFSNTDWNLIRDCPVPLLLVKPHEIGATLSIIAAVDPVHDRDKPAELDHRILDYAQGLATSFDASLHVLHAFDAAPAYAVSADSMAFPISMPMNELIEGLKQRHDEAVVQLMKNYAIPDTNIHVLEGDVCELLVTLAEKVRADVVVMGAVSRGALKRLVLGSTAERLLDRVPCDVLIVKPNGMSASVEES